MSFLDLLTNFLPDYRSYVSASYMTDNLFLDIIQYEFCLDRLFIPL